MSYVPEEHQESIAEDLAILFHQEELLVAFAKRSAELYDDYDEYAADEIMRRVKQKFLLMHAGCEKKG